MTDPSVMTGVEQAVAQPTMDEIYEQFKSLDSIGILKQMNYFQAGDISTVVKTAVEDFQFSGFKPQVIFAMMARCCANDLGVLYVDVVRLITLCLTRGTKIEKIRRTLKEEKVVDFDSLIKKYSIQTTGSKRPGEKVITLSRICAAFPTVAVQVLCTGAIKVESEKGLPDELCFPAAASLISGNPSLRRYQVAYMKWSRKFTARIKGAAAGEMIANLLNMGDHMVREKQWNIAAYYINTRAKGEKVMYSTGDGVIDFKKQSLKVILELEIENYLYDADEEPSNKKVKV